jgi:hypothetical protein
VGSNPASRTRKRRKEEEMKRLDRENGRGVFHGAADLGIGRFAAPKP